MIVYAFALLPTVNNMSEPGAGSRNTRSIYGRNIKTENPAADEIKAWWKLSRAAAEEFFQHQRQLLQGAGPQQKAAGALEDEQIALLAADGMLVKRPLAVLPDRVLVGFKEDEWAEKLAR